MINHLESQNSFCLLHLQVYVGLSDKVLAGPSAVLGSSDKMKTKYSSSFPEAHNLTVQDMFSKLFVGSKLKSVTTWLSSRALGRSHSQ